MPCGKTSAQDVSAVNADASRRQQRDARITKLAVLDHGQTTRSSSSGMPCKASIHHQSRCQDRILGVRERKDEKVHSRWMSVGPLWDANIHGLREEVARRSTARPVHRLIWKTV